MGYMFYCQRRILSWIENNWKKQKDTMAPFMKLEMDGILSNMLILTFGQ
jgi:hypothetical protein